MVPPGIEPGTFSVLTRCHNQLDHGTRPCDRMRKRFATRSLTSNRMRKTCDTREDSERWLLGAVVAGLVLALAFHHVFSGGRLAPDWAMVMCDVGQGDGLVVATGDGRVVVIDVGPDPTSMDRCLNMLGVDDIALVLISHFHADHIAGLDAVLAGRSVSAVGVGPMLLPESGVRAVDAAARAHGVPLVGLRAGSTFVLGTVQFDVLGPVLPVPRDVSGADASANDQSLVLMAHTSAGRILLTGDSETAGEASMTRSGIDVRADVLKLPHHGSRTTSHAFLEAVRPRLTLVSSPVSINS